MIINKKIDSYIIHKDKSINHALARLESSGEQILFLIDSIGKLQGVVTDGDIRRWLMKDVHKDFEKPISTVAPDTYVYSLIDEDPNEIKKYFHKGIKHIPLVSDLGIISAVASSGNSYITIGQNEIGSDKPVYIIAEVGNNHQGKLENAKALIEMAAEAGVNSVKFQMRSLSDLYGKKSSKKDAAHDLGAQYTLDLLSRFQLSDDEMFQAFDYCKKCGVDAICTPWDIESLKKLESYDIEAYKVASADFTNHELLQAIAKTNKPMICSTGMTTEDEILSSTNLLKTLGAQCILLHCNSTYPTPFKDVNLKYLSSLKKFGFDVGYSGHERGNFIPLAAIALGACVIEKHITFDKKQEGNDHKVSLLPNELKEMVDQIRMSEEALGKNEPRVISQGEMINREVLAKSLYASKNIKAGEIITRDIIKVKSPGQGLQPNMINSLLGKPANRDIPADTCFYNSDLIERLKKKTTYKFKRPFGIPVRYHDFKKLSSEVNLSFVEFHLSYNDLNENPSDFINETSNLFFSVHAPELFENDHILDLCSLDESYRKLSVNHLNRVIEHTQKIGSCFSNQSPPYLVVNAGGWNTDGFVNDDKKTLLYKSLKKSLKEIDSKSVNIVFQTMPPFPWHFGGQSYHNLFVDPQEIDDFCKETGSKVCLDVSHTMMACNYYGWDLNVFINKIADHIDYLHIVDAKDSDGEGVQLGEGDVDFYSLSKVLNETLPKAPFIPEIWQGHKDSGSGFWHALDFLEEFF